MDAAGSPGGDHGAPAPALDPKYAGMLEAWEAHQRELRASVAATEGGAGTGGVPERGPEAPEGD